MCAPSHVSAAAIAALATVLATAAARPALARIAVTATPIRLELELAPGESASRAVQLINSGDHPVEVTPEIWDWWFQSDGRRLLAPPAGRPESIATWVTVQPARMLAKPNSSVAFLVTVSVPADATGGRSAVLYLKARGSSPDGAAAIGVELGAQVLVDTGVTVPAVDARFVSVRPPGQYDKLVCELELENSGDVFLWVEPTLDIVGPLDEFVASIAAAPEERILLLPGETTTARFEWGGALAPATYQLIGTIYYGDRVTVSQTELAIADTTLDPGPTPHPVGTVLHSP